MPPAMIEQTVKVVRESQRLVRKLGRDPTDDEVAKRLRWSTARIRATKEIATQPMLRQTVSLETPIGDEEDSILGDFIEDKDVEDPYIVSVFRLLQEQLLQVLSTLPEREQDVLSMRFGLEAGYSLTPEAVGRRRFKVTGQRIRQIEAKALRRLRFPWRSIRLKDYLDDSIGSIDESLPPAISDYGQELLRVRLEFDDGCSASVGEWPCTSAWLESVSASSIRGNQDGEPERARIIPTNQSWWLIRRPPPESIQSLCNPDDRQRPRGQGWRLIMNVSQRSSTTRTTQRSFFTRHCLKRKRMKMSGKMPQSGLRLTRATALPDLTPSTAAC